MQETKRIRIYLLLYIIIIYVYCINIIHITIIYIINIIIYILYILFRTHLILNGHISTRSGKEMFNTGSTTFTHSKLQWSITILEWVQSTWWIQRT